MGGVLKRLEELLAGEAWPEIIQKIRARTEWRECLIRFS